MRWSCGILIMHVLCIYTELLKYIVADHGTSSHTTFPQSLWGCVTCFTIEVENSNRNSKTKNIANYTYQEGNIMELLLTRHCFHDV